MDSNVSLMITVSDFLKNDKYEVNIKNELGFTSIEFLKDRTYSIPAYQREIRWTGDNVNILMNDIACGKKFLGTILLNKVSESCYEIIDGQQRVSVFLLILNVLKSYSYNFEMCNFKNETYLSLPEVMDLDKDAGLKRSQQMFADLNKHAVKSSMSTSTLYDYRDDLSNAVKDVVFKISFLNKYVDKEKDNLGKHSSKLFTLANFLRANKRIVKKGDEYSSYSVFLLNFWASVFSNISEWELLENKQLTKCALREEYVLTLSVTLQAFGRLGAYLFSNNKDLAILKGLKNIDWLRSNREWHDRIIDKQGKIINNEDSIIKMCSLLKKKLGIILTREEETKENEIKR